MADCIFCKIIAGEIPSDFVYQDEKLVVFRDIHPKAKTHLLFVPKTHVKSLLEVEESHQDMLAHMMLVLPKVARDVGLGNGFRTVINTGPAGGQEIDHLHLHLLGGGIPKF
jgi:histidine triad (HIT) family protein